MFATAEASLSFCASVSGFGVLVPLRCCWLRFGFILIRWLCERSFIVFPSGAMLLLYAGFVHWTFLLICMETLKLIQLGWCGSCEQPLMAEHVVRWGEGRDESGEPVRVMKIKCGACGVKGFLTFTLDELASLEAKAAEQYDRQHRELIGRMVHGFRMDLDVVDSVEDFLLEWRSDERFRLSSVPREDGKRAFLPDVVWS